VKKSTRISEADRIIKEFLEKDGNITDNFIRKSVLLQILRDLKFNLGIGRDEWTRLQLNAEQNKTKNEILPLLTPVLLFCSGVDLLARAELKRDNRANNGQVFKDFLQQHFGLSVAETEVMWSLRNALTHQYKLPKNIVLHRAGSSSFIEKVHQKDYWFIYVHSMYTKLDKVKNEILTFLMSEPESEKSKTVKFISEHGFILQQVSAEIKTAG
jgi:hypothetical protein